MFHQSLQYFFGETESNELSAPNMVEVEEGGGDLVDMLSGWSLIRAGWPLTIPNVVLGHASTGHRDDRPTLVHNFQMVP